MTTLRWCRPGTKFRLAEMPEVSGTLVKVNDCRAVVKLDRPEREVEFTDNEGATRRFKSSGSQVTSWAPTTVVVPAGFDGNFSNQENEDMAKKSSKKAAASTKTESKAKKANPWKNPPEATAEAAAAPVAKKPAAETKDSKQPKEPKPQKEPKPTGKLSCIDAAAQVLQEATQPMGTAEMIEAMAAKGLWSGPNGKTPAATLYSAILREINSKGAESRFKKADRGKFEFAK